MRLLPSRAAHGNHEAIDPAREHRAGMLGHRSLACNFGNNSRLARDEVIDRLDDLDAATFFPRGLAAPYPGERADDAALRPGGAQSCHDVLRHAAAADKPDRGHGSITRRITRVALR